ncbi:MAG: type II toxin-antitoxin system RelE/ParE family toxin [Planctomycetes bacterium]|nr:type II toxin-antitoxin system RelE/ParE family toxin [Planctomycetota bacterium]
MYLYIARQDNRRDVAKKIYAEIREHCDRYAELFAGGHTIGTERSDLQTGVRSFTHQRWVVLFRPLEKTIRVLAVFDGSQEYAKFFEERGESG